MKMDKNERKREEEEEDDSEWTTIRIRKKTRDTLRERGARTENYDETLQRILKDTKPILVAIK